ncbi:intercellular adhesion molecule 5-like [Pseudophryne corroboree]|uniref:intercellular adhesion molecule 5-like n=1 Tax=Pseudophryne corroboree TaxID=495146 RepID=UPI003081AA9E
MEVSCIWSLLVIWIFRTCKVHALLPIPILNLEDRVKVNEETKISCSLPASECSCLEVELKIVTKERLRNCVSYKGDFPNITCTLEVTKEMDEMELSCEAHFRTKSKPQNLNIQTQPEFTDCPENVIWIAGKENRFHCKAKGYPSPTVTCKKDDVEYNTMQKYTSSKNMSGNYHCRAENFNETSKTVTVIVEYEPETPSIIAQPSTSVFEGANLTLTCDADAVPPPTYSWHTPASQVTYLHDNRTIQIRDVKISHEGYYMCIAQNKHGIEMMKQKIAVNSVVIVPETKVEKSSDNSKGARMEPVYTQILAMLISLNLFYYLC